MSLLELVTKMHDVPRSRPDLDEEHNKQLHPSMRQPAPPLENPATP